MRREAISCMRGISRRRDISSGLGRYVLGICCPVHSSEADIKQNYDPADLKGESEPTFSLDRALRAHNINEGGNGGIELQERSHLMNDYDKSARKGTLDPRDPVEIAGDDGKYADLEIAQADASGSGGISRPRAESGGLKEGLKKRIGSLRKKHRDE